MHTSFKCNVSTPLLNIQVSRCFPSKHLQQTTDYKTITLHRPPGNLGHGNHNND